MTEVVSFDVATGNNKKILVGSAALIGIGLFILVPPLVNGWGADRWVPAGIVAGILVLLGLVPILGRKVFLRRRRVLLDAAGIRWDDPSGSWAVRWDELAAVAVSSTGVPNSDLVAAPG